MTEFNSDDDLRGARFDQVDLTGARIRNSYLRDVRVHGAWLEDVDIDGHIERMTVNGVDVVPLAVRRPRPPPLRAQPRPSGSP